MEETVEERAVILGRYMAEHGATVRGAAERFGVSKSTVHKDVSRRLQRINPSLYDAVRKVLEKNKSERHMRGGLATREKYRLKKLLQQSI